MKTNDTIELKEIDAAELARVEGGYYGPCGCTPIPFPYPECPTPPEGSVPL